MVSGYLKTEQGLAEYAKIGATYQPEFMSDTLYEEWKRTTSIENMEQYTSHKPIELQSVNRIKLGDGTQWLTFSTVEYRLDSSLNLTSRPRSPHGVHPKPQGLYSMEFGDFGKQIRKLKEVMSVDPVYDIPFTPENLDKIRDEWTSPPAGGGTVQYGITMPNKMRFTVEDYDSLRNEKFEVLAHFGKTPTPKQLDDWLTQEGYKNDEQKINEAMIKRTDPSIKGPVTMDQVEELLKKERKKEEK